uniref:ADAM metallopeptidase with thrombospondin type 1 motif 13 n=1 Tax=Chrysemys picta bellii TaxID=8478 RepID=A0A8C3IAL8_CHRPI
FLKALDAEDVFSYFGTSAVLDGIKSPRLWKRAEGRVMHLELLVVVGPDVYQFHKEDTERYILTNLNIGAELLRDASLGAQLRVHLMRMMVLTEPEVGMNITTNITSSLVSVCEWSKKVNPQSDSDPLHADLVLYVTRSGASQPGVETALRSCNITPGDQLEIIDNASRPFISCGSFGLHHDGEGNRCSGSGNVMGSEGYRNSVDLVWSDCSREQFLAFLRTGQASCLNDLPDLEGSIPGWKPGLYYGADEQCKIAFGSAATACTFARNDIDMCRVLSCHTHRADQTSCTRLLVPLLDGTECGINKWCSKGRCSSLEELTPVAVVHGQWSSWSPLTACSRSCGGGVVTRRRLCNNPRPAFGGQECRGADLQAEMCNTQACLTSQLEFMADQCAATNVKPLYLIPEVPFFYKWTSAAAYAKGDTLCKHMCKAEKKNFMVSRGVSFTDGTRCEQNNGRAEAAFDLCVMGSCRVFGCDGRMDSGMVLDSCRVCGGDNATCTRVSGSYAEGKAKEYVTFLALPHKTTLVYVANRKPLFTHLAVKVQGRYVVAGRERISLNTTYPSVIEDNQIKYRVFLTEDNLPSLEEVHVDGPTQEDIEIQVYRKYGKEYGDVTNPDITFSYFIPKEKQTHVWIPQFRTCSVSCGEGVLLVDHSCFDQTRNEITDDQQCLETPQPSSRQEPCAMAPCPQGWVAGDFGPCSATCGGGAMERLVRCMKKEGGLILTLPDSKCTDAPKPASTKACSTEPCPIRWKESELGKCSAICGVGVTQQNVTCVQILDGLETTVDDSLCPAEEKPLAFVPCVVNICPLGWNTVSTLAWLMGNLTHWPVEDPRLGRTIFLLEVERVLRTEDSSLVQRMGSAVSRQGSVVWVLVQMFSPFLSPPSWEVKELAACPVSCGGGRIPLSLRCVRQEGNTTRPLPHSKCGRMPRPDSTKECGTDPWPGPGTRWKRL